MDFPKLSTTSPTKLISTPAVLAFASIIRGRLSGALQIRSEKIIRQFYWNKGDCISVLSNAKSEIPGTLFMKQGRINSTQYQNYLNEVRKPKADPWAILQQIVGISSEEILEKKKELCLQLASTAGLTVKGDALFQPSTPAVQKTSVIPGLRVLISATSLLKPEQVTEICPLFVDSTTILQEKMEDEFGSLPLSPEEKGLLTVIKNSKNISEVFSGSFLGPEKIQSLMFAYWLFGLVPLESVQATEHRKHEEKLSAQDQTLRKEIETRFQQMEKQNYYKWLGIFKDAPPSEIQEKISSLIEKYAAPSVEALFLESEKEKLEGVLKHLEDARQVLLHTEKRNEYNEFIKKGGSGSFLTQSRTIQEEGVAEQAVTLFSTGKSQEAVALYQESLKTSPSPTLAASFSRALLKFQGVNHPKAKEMALSALQKALEQNPKNALIFEAMGEWLEALKDSSKSYQCFLKVLQIKPVSSNARQAILRLDPKRGAEDINRIFYLNLKKINYYQLLNIEPKSNVKEIHKAYRKATKHFHPDRFFQSSNDGLKFQAKETYKRMVDAYMTLKNSAKRQEYDRKLMDSKGTETALSSRPKRSETTEINTLPLPKTRQGKKFFELANTAIRQGNLEAAKLNLQLGLQYEPDSSFMKKKLKELSQK